MDNNTYVPKLTLNPTAAAAQEAPAVEEEKKDIPVEKLDIEKLSPEEQAAVREFASQIDITDTNQILSYGAAALASVLGNCMQGICGVVGSIAIYEALELSGAAKFIKKYIRKSDK